MWHLLHDLSLSIAEAVWGMFRWARLSGQIAEGVEPTGGRADRPEGPT